MPEAQTDDDGFTEVAYRRTTAGRRRGSAAAGVGDATHDAGGASEAAGGATRPREDAGLGTNCDDAMGADEVDAEADHGDGAGAAGDGDLGEEDAAHYKRLLDQEVAMVRWLEREGVAAEHPSMVAALEARAEAERNWKECRAPQPLGKRMGWAQSKLDRAYRQQDRIRHELAVFDDEVKAQRAKICERLDAVRSKVTRHREALERLQEEAGELAPTARRGRIGKAVCARIIGGLKAAVAPNVLALAASLQDGTEAKGQVNTLMGQLAHIQQQLEEVAAGEGEQDNSTRQDFDIAEGDGSEDYWSESHELDDRDLDTSATRGQSAEARTTEPQWRAQGHSRWRNTAGTDGNGNDSSRHGEGATGDGGHSAATATPPRAAGRPREQDEPTRRADAGASVRGAEGGQGPGASGDEPRSKSRKGQAAEDSQAAANAVHDTRKAVELMAQQAAAASAGFGTQAAMQIAGQQYAQHVAAVTRRAIAQGVQPITDEGLDLIMVGPEELARWAATHLKDGDGDE